MRPRTMFAAAAVSLLAAAALVTPAQALERVWVPSPHDNSEATAAWYSDLKKLCAKADINGVAVGAIKRSNGTWARVRDYPGDGERTCRNYPGIPARDQTILKVTLYHTGHKHVETLDIIS